MPASIDIFEVYARARVIDYQGSYGAAVSELFDAVIADLRTGRPRAAVDHVALDCTEGTDGVVRARIFVAVCNHTPSNQSDITGNGRLLVNLGV